MSEPLGNAARGEEKIYTVFRPGTREHTLDRRSDERLSRMRTLKHHQVFGRELYFMLIANIFLEVECVLLSSWNRGNIGTGRVSLNPDDDRIQLRRSSGRTCLRFQFTRWRVQHQPS